jgi:D-alanyl-D-alanine dipeptidase
VLVVLAACASAPPVFRIEPVRPVAELRQEALLASPPVETGEFRPRDLVDLATLDPTLRFDIRYATSSNFLGTPVYDAPRAFLERPAAEALLRVHRALAARGYGLLIHDAYRPWYVTKLFWDATPPVHHGYVADPAGGSRHNRGCAVDLTLYDLRTGRVAQMPSGYDEFSERAHEDYAGGTRAERDRRELLRAAMAAEGFTVLPSEWWHFDFRDWQSYAIQNVRFDELQ